MKFYLFIYTLFFLPGLFIVSTQSDTTLILTAIFSISLGSLLIYLYKNKDNERIQRILNILF
jgi:hypothetical protein